MQFEKWYNVDLLKPRQIIPDLGFPVFTGDNNSVRFGVNLFSDKQPIDASGTVTGYVILPNGMMTPPITGEKGGNKVWIDLPEIALEMTGRIQVAIRLIDGEEETVISAASATVRRVDADVIIDPDDVVPSWEDILTKIAQMDAAADACNDAAEAAEDAAEGALANFAPAFAEATANAAGSYVTYTDGKMYLLPNGHTVNTTWANTTKSEVKVGGELTDLKGAIEEMTAATAEDEGKALIAKTVSGGKVTEWEFGNTGFGGDPVKVTDFDMSTASTWAGQSKGLFILDAPIINASGNVVLEFYNTSTHSSWATAPFWFILYERTEAGTFEVVNKTSVSTPSAIGKFSVTTDWNVTNDKIYYIGVWRAGSGYIPYINGGYSTFYKTGIYDADSNITIGSEVQLSDLSTAASNTALLNITVIPDGKIVDTHVARQRLVHFSVDDSVFWADLIANENTYASCFENAQLKRWKKLHDMFGICVTLNCFCSDGTHSIEDVPDKWADEFAANAYWLKFAFHAQDSETYYDTDKVDAITASYNTFVTAIIKMTGTPDAIDPVTRLGFYSGTLANVQAIRDADCGITGLLTSDDTRTSYYLNTAQNGYILAHNMLFDADNQILFIHTMPRLESVSGTVAALDAYLGKDWQNQNEVLEFFTHELTMTDSMAMTVEVYANWALIHGMRFGFSSEMLLKIETSVESRQGKDGKSAYEYAVDGGYTGTEQEFIADLAAMDGLANELAEI